MIEIKNLKGDLIITLNLDNIRCADLRDAYLTGADLKDADLRGAYLRDANLTDADLRGANINIYSIVNSVIKLTPSVIEILKTLLK